MKDLTLHIPRKAAIAGAVVLLLLLVAGVLGVVHKSGRFARQETRLKTTLDKLPVIGGLSRSFFNPQASVKVDPEVALVARNQEKLAGAYEAARLRVDELETEKEHLALQVKAQQAEVLNAKKTLNQIQGLLEELKKGQASKAEAQKTAQAAAQAVKRQLEKDLKPRLASLDRKVSQKGKTSEEDLARQGLAFKRLSKVYAEMDADVIAEIFQDKTLKESQAVEILRRLPKDKISEVLAAMDASTAAAYTRLLAERVQ